jgi:hypothetical protein
VPANLSSRQIRWRFRRTLLEGETDTHQNDVQVGQSYLTQLGRDEKRELPGD